MKTTKSDIGRWMIIAISMTSLITVFTHGALTQDKAYHQFSDERTLAYIPHFWNVCSNTLFIISGCIGMAKLYNNRLNIIMSFKVAYICFFAGIIFTGLGSAYYHLNPTNETLVYDRLPMAFTFMVLFSIIISEYISVQRAKKLLLPLVLTGIYSVVYWHLGEQKGSGDLRMYVLVQFLPLLIIPVVLLLYPAKYSKSGYGTVLILYLIAKGLEHFDSQVFAHIQFVSGHTLKHFVSAMAMFVLIRNYEKRKLL